MDEELFTDTGTDWLLDTLDDFQDFQENGGALRERRAPDLSKMRGQALWLIGGPASGKTSFAFKHHLRHDAFVHVDPDAWKEKHPDYDPKQPWLLHGWSSQMATEQLADVIESGESFVRDGTGTNVERMKDEIQRAEDAGYRTSLVYVRVPLEVSLDRAARRERVVPPEVVSQLHSKAEGSYRELKDIVDNVRVIAGDQVDR